MSAPNWLESLEEHISDLADYNHITLLECWEAVLDMAETNIEQLQQEGQ